MEQSNQDFLSSWQKKWAFFFALFFSIIGAMYLSSNFLQAKMKGTWVISDSSIDYGFESIPKEVIIEPNQIKIDGNRTIHISYGSKSNRTSIARKNFDKGDIIYSFYDKQDTLNSYMLIYNRKSPDELVLMIKKSDDVDGEEINLFTLDRKEAD